MAGLREVNTRKRVIQAKKKVQTKTIAMSLRLEEDLWSKLKKLSVDKRTSMHAMVTEQLRKMVNAKK